MSAPADAVATPAAAAPAAAAPAVESPEFVGIEVSNATKVGESAVVKPLFGLTLVGDVDAAVCEGDSCSF